MQFDPRLTQYLDYLDAMQAQHYAKGGKVVDFLAEVLKGSSKAKPKPTKDQPDPGRRAALGLPKDLTPKPGEMVVKEEVKKAPKTGETSVSLTEAMNVPMSRRDVLRAGAGQAISAMAPRGALGALAKAAASPTGVVEQVVKAAPAPFNPTTVAGIIAEGLKRGMSDDDIVKSLIERADELRGIPNFPVDLIKGNIESVRAPFHNYVADENVAYGPLAVMDQLLGSPDSMLKSLREIRKVDPDRYKELADAARDTDMTMSELYPGNTYQHRLRYAKSDAREEGRRFSMKKFRERYGYDKDFNPDPEDPEIFEDYLD